jgi:hypothetical protein
MEADSRQLEVLRRSGTLTMHMQDAHACSSPGSRIPAPPCSSSGQHVARPCTADPRGTPACPGARPMTANPSSSVQGRRVNVLSLVDVPPLRLSESGAPHSPDMSAGSPASAGRQHALAAAARQSWIGLGSPRGVSSPRRSTAAPSVVLQPAQWQAAGDATTASASGSAGAAAACCIVRRHSSSSCSSGSATPSQARRRSSTATGAAAAAVAGLVPLLQACSPRRSGPARPATRQLLLHSAAARET